MHVKFKISKKGKIIGDFTFFEVVDGLAEGRLTGSDYFWTQGMGEWIPLKDFSDYDHSQVNTGGMVQVPSVSGPDMVPENNVKAVSSFEPRCPSCTSKSVQACGMGFAAGTRASESLGVSSRGTMYYRTGRSASFLAAALAPPVKSGANILFVIIFLGGLLGTALWYAKYGPADWRSVDQGEKWMTLVVALLASIGGLVALVADATRTSAEHEEAIKRWQKQWYCKKCGTIFTPDI